MKRTMLALLAAWLLGIATALGGVAVTGGWYEYRFVPVMPENRSDPVLREVFSNTGGWQPEQQWSSTDWWVKRPRIRLGW